VDTLDLPLVERREVARGTMSFAFDLEGRSFPFRPGQFIYVTQPAPLYHDEKGNRRHFSIASSPRERRLLIATRMRGSAFKHSLAEVPLGTRLEIRGPAGSFTLHANIRKPAILIAGGIGITPFRSMVKDATEQQLPYRLTLIYSNRAPEDAPFLDEFEGWAMENRHFRFVPTMTEPESTGTTWRGRTGRVDTAFLREVLAEAGGAVCYVAGPPDMARGIVQALRAAGTDDEAIRTEEFTGY